MTAESNIDLIAEGINLAHKATRTVTIVLKNMVQPCRFPLHKADIWTQEGLINVGSNFSDLARIIAKVKDKARIGVCFDTCKPISLFPI